MSEIKIPNDVMQAADDVCKGLATNGGLLGPYLPVNIVRVARAILSERAKSSASHAASASDAAPTPLYNRSKGTE